MSTLFGAPIPEYKDGVYSIETFANYWPDRDFIEVQINKTANGEYHLFDHKTKKSLQLSGEELYDLKPQFIRNI